jgi:hypothetical protein
MTFASLDAALQAGFHIYDKHPDGYLVRKEVSKENGRRWILAVALGPRRV